MVGSTTVQGDGTWTSVLSGLTPGTHQVTAAAATTAGTTAPSPATTVTVGGLPPDGSDTAASSCGDGSSCGIGGGLATLGLLLIVLLLRPLRLRSAPP